MAQDDSLFVDAGGSGSLIEKALDSWNQETITKLQESLDSKASTGTSGMLRQSIEPQAIEQTDTGLSLEIVMEDYYKFIDEGVQGVGGERADGSIFEQVAPNSPFSYKQGAKPSYKHFELWSATKGLNPFAVAESVFRKGIKPNHFYSDVITPEWIDNLVKRLEVAGAGTVEILIINEIEDGK